MEGMVLILGGPIWGSPFMNHRRRLARGSPEEVRDQGEIGVGLFFLTQSTPRHTLDSWDAYPDLSMRGSSTTRSIAEIIELMSSLRRAIRDFSLMSTDVEGKSRVFWA